ncbi:MULTISPECIES: AraC family transcriptional regulator [Chryseobacterium]|uniref:AraC-like DNA-binding protein n=1 Tax=Chryseobacterium geocarposphaerae TaxID=1416776 RepID=A0ABU1LIF7_9FLAO|nr:MULTISPECIES: AraC family transcriptional regulator [Chryseobacterium]MDR6406512.1 AraC-like DNA-binding protein [Chryseobacterium geocarposphaerae]MDR6699989.1 AraC-like DNA-binding protein [Chryseobacterium ginsenosidimutans]
MWLKKFVTVLILQFFGFITAQSSPDFYILSDKAFQKLYQNPDDCINYSLSILNSDKNIEHKIVLRNIISQAYAMKGDYLQSASTASHKEDASENETLSYFVQTFIDYNLADQYQNLDLYNQSQKIISNLLSDSKLLKNEDQKIRITVAKLYQLQALNLGINRNLTTALENLDKSDQYIDNHNEENKIIGFENKIFRSAYLLRQNHLPEARQTIENVILSLEKEENQPYLSALAYENYSRYYFQKGDYTAANYQLEKALSKVEKLPFNPLKARIYESLSKNYLALHNDEKYHDYNKLYIDLKTKIDASTKEGIRYIVKLAENSQNKSIEFQKQNQFKRFWILTLTILLVIIGLIIYFLILKNKNKELKKQFEFFEKQKKREKIIPDNIQVSKEKNDLCINKNIEKDSNKISKEKECEILQKLEEWEQSDQYLSKSMSLSMLSAQMGVNTKYLSEVINNNKGKNFNGYINDLRINHIAHLLKTDSTYLNYKVSYLAEYSGFSSHSAFTTIFKSVTGMSPNAYIQEISKSRTS